MRYIAQVPKLAAVVSLKGGVSIVGASWVLFSVMAERTFTVPISGLSPARVGLIGMSLLMGARGIGALVGPLLASRLTGQREASLRAAVLFGFLLGGVGYLLLECTKYLVGVCRDYPRALWNVDCLGVFNDVVTSEHRGPLPGTNLWRRTGDLDAATCEGDMDRRTVD